MNYRMIGKIIGRVLLAETVLMLIPMLISICSGEGDSGFFWSILITLGVSYLFQVRKPSNTAIFAREGYITVAAAWVAVSVCGCLPFLFSGAITNPVDALFETISGFTTTGASILSNVESLTRGLQFWRCLTHWIGGMGVLVFVMAVMPLSEERSMHLMRAELPGPSVGKLVPRIRRTASILYCIYIVLTLVEMLLLWLGNMDLFDAAVHALSTAGTGGFSNKNASIAYYDSIYIEMVIAVFMFIFALNFNLFYLILIGRAKLAFKNEELRIYTCMILFSTVTIALSLWRDMDMGFAQAMRYSFFQVCALSSSTGFVTTNFDLWPEYSKFLLMILMLIGASAGSTGGGIKVSRVIILVKTAWRELYHQSHPRRIKTIITNGQMVDDMTIHNVLVFFLLYMIVAVAAFILLSIGGYDFTTIVTSVITCLSNSGPGLEAVGPVCNYGFMSNAAKLLLSFCMLLGRLEIFPLMMLFSRAALRR